MVGEIRDLETAEIAVQSSLTGHLVLSTLHTNTAIGAITRLLDMGIEPFLLASSLVGLLAQRLVRVLCPKCREAFVPGDYEQQLLAGRFPNPEHPVLYRAVGCTFCHRTGFRGRTGIYEFVAVGSKIRQMIHDRRGEQEIEQQARTESPSIYDDGLDRVAQGITTLEEVLRVTRAD
jgi:general secretion pathway protein E